MNRSVRLLQDRQQSSIAATKFWVVDGLSNLSQISDLRSQIMIKYRIFVEVRPSSAVPVEQKSQSPNTRKLFSRSAAVFGRPRRIEVSSNFAVGLSRGGLNSPGCYWAGAASDGRAPTEELSCFRGWDVCSTKRRRRSRPSLEPFDCPSRTTSA